MTELEQMIVDYLKPKRSRSVTSHQISHGLNLNNRYGARGKQIVGMTIGRMRKKGIEANYGALK